MKHTTVLLLQQTRQWIS